MKKYLLISIILFLISSANFFAQVTQQWVQRYNGPGNGNDYGVKLAVEGSGNVYVTGFSTGVSNNFDFATIKYNSAGIQQWVQRYNGPADSIDVPEAILLDGSGNVYVTGYSTGTGTGFDFATIKYNSSGIQQWIQRYNGPGNGNDYGKALAMDGLDNLYVAGSSFGNGTGDDYTLIKYNSNGVQQGYSVMIILQMARNLLLLLPLMV